MVCPIHSSSSTSPVQPPTFRDLSVGDVFLRRERIAFRLRSFKPPASMLTIFLQCRPTLFKPFPVRLLHPLMLSVSKLPPKYFPTKFSPRSLKVSQPERVRNFNGGREEAADMLNARPRSFGHRLALKLSRLPHITSTV